MTQHTPPLTPEVAMAHKYKELESAHWVDKMKTLFSTLDRDGKGYITLEDNQRSPKRMNEAFNLPKEKADAILDYTRRVGWVKLLNAGEEPPEGHRVTEKMFMESMAQAVNSPDLDVAKALVKPHLMTLDLDEDGFITKDDYLTIFRAQLVDVRPLEMKFEMLDSDKDGRITVEEYTKDMRCFLTDLGHHGDDRDGQDVCSRLGDEDSHRTTMFGYLISDGGV